MFRRSDNQSPSPSDARRFGRSAEGGPSKATRSPGSRPVDSSRSRGSSRSREAARRRKVAQSREEDRSRGTSRPPTPSTRASRAARSTWRGDAVASRSVARSAQRGDATESRHAAGRRSGQPDRQSRGSARASFRASSGRAGAGDAASQPELVSTGVGELRREARRERMRARSRRRLLAAIGAIGLVVVLLAGWAALYHSSAFKVANVAVNGVEHLTSEEMAQLANVPSDTTLLRVDAATIESRLEQNAWVADAQVNLVFPDTLEINVIERAIFAIVEIPSGSSSTVKKWAIAEDRTWLMPIPDAGTDAAKTTSAKVYEDAENVLHIVDVPYGTKAEIGKTCSDANVNNALEILSGLTTELAGRVAEVSAAGTAETTLMLDNGVEVAFGKAEDIRDKERVILQILADNPDNVSYINVRMVESPTWRSL